jgi:hypothetical protein
LEWIRDESDVEDEESDAFRDVVIAGMAWMEIHLETVDEVKVVNRRVDNVEMRWDRTAKRRNLEDAKRIHRVREIALDDARAMFPGAADADLDAAWARDDQVGEPIDREDARDYNSGNALTDEEIGKRGTVTLVETQWKEVVSLTTVTAPPSPPDPMNPMAPPPPPETMELPEDEAIRMAETAANMGVPVKLGKPRQQTTVHRAYMGAKMLENKPLPVQGEGFSYKVMTGKWDRKLSVFYGLIRAAKQPQEWANKWLSQSQHILNTMARNGIDYETGAFVNEVKALEDWNKPGSAVEFNEGVLVNGKVRPRPSNAGMPTGIENSLTFALQSIRDTTGINLELSGLADREQAGILETQRKQAGVTILAVFFDNLRRYRKAAGRMTLKYALELLPPEQLIRAVGEERGEALEKLMDPKAQSYDVVVEEAPTSANAKERAWAAVSPLLPILIEKASPTILAEVVRMSPIDSQTAEKIAQELTAPPSPEAKQKQAEQEEQAKASVQAMVQETQAAAFQKQTAGQLNLAKIGEVEAEAQAHIIEAMNPPPVVINPPRQPMNGASR